MAWRKKHMSNTTLEEYTLDEYFAIEAIMQEGEKRMSNTTWEDYFASLPDEKAERARKQFELPIDDFIDKVKCCHNCPYWDRDYSLMGDYAYNMCPVLSLRENDKYRITRWDYYCNSYNGTRTEENLLFGADMGEKQNE